MGWRIVKQPDGLYARFSDVVDHFTHYGFTRDEALNLCINDNSMCKHNAEEKVQRADDNPGRWEEELETIKLIHGEDNLKETVKTILGGRLWERNYLSADS